MAKKISRITYYQDPLNDREWIVAGDDDDPSEEVVIAGYETRKQALKAAEEEAAKRGVRVEYAPSTLL